MGQDLVEFGNMTVSHHEVKRELISDGVRVVIMGKFGMGDVVCPRSGVIPTEDPKVHFDFLVYPIGFSVRLGVVGSGKG